MFKILAIRKSDRACCEFVICSQKSSVIDLVIFLHNRWSNVDVVVSPIENNEHGREFIV